MESGNVSLSGTVTGGVSLGIDWIWNIDNNQRVITNNLTHSTLQYSVTECRDVNVEVIARNPVSETSAFCVQRVLYPLQGYVIEPLTGFYQTTDQVEITLRSGSQNFPVGNTTLQILTNETSAGTLLINISLTNTDLQDVIQFQHSFIEQGYYNVYGSLKSEINIVNLSTIVGIWDKLENLDLNISKSFISVYDSIQLTWIFPPRSDFSFKISYGDGTYRTHSASDSQIFSGTSWLKAYNSVGRYTINVYAWNAVYSKNISHSVQVEESITNVELKCTRYVSTKEGSTILNAVVDRGADLGVEWIWRVNHTFHESQSSNQNYTSLQYQISQTGNLHIGILARNNISEMSTSCLVTFLNPLDGFYIDIPNIYYETTETINITIKTNLDNPYPVGITSLNLKINDTSGSNVIDLANLTDDQVKSGLFLQHAFELQGNYKIFGNISSVNESKFMEVVVRIWDKLDGLNFTTSSTGVTVLENFDLELTSTPRSYFNFILHFGDGTLLENEKDSYKDRFFQTPLSKNYSAIGNYEICCRGWNEVYSTKVCSFMLCENNIDAIMLTCDFPRHVRVGTELDFMASIINGAEVEIMWTWIFQPLEFQRTVTTENNITEISLRKEIGLDGGEINITVIAANKVSEVSDSCSVVSLHPIQELGLYAETYQTLETAYIYIQNTSLTLYPQGIITAVGYLQNENGSVLLQNFTNVSDEKIQREEIKTS
ncbi:uncharacterized protein LOC134236595 [Saccostrea cucullata]|uniref:uncharacterized protein LOC134236595 n=1 Tax=Saccostrea cuccullata TaxID=36930 RepID=UPI002ED58A7C